MSLLAVVVIVIVLGAIAAFAPIDANFKRLLYGLAAAVVVIYLLLLLFGVADVGWPHRSTVTVP